MSTSTPSNDRPARGIAELATTILNSALALVVLGLLIAAALPVFEAAREPQPVRLPSAMVDVDWHDPESSQFCLACHKQVSRAMAGLDVERGHSQNVTLNEQQLTAIAAMGTVAGPNNTLICMSCHELGASGGHGHMLAVTLEDSRMCQRCHPGHYARGTAHDLRISAPDDKNRFGQTAAEGGPCSACHLAHSYAREIQRSPLDPEGYCLPCHSRYHVAEGHARVTMDHPESRCRECHDPHTPTDGAFLAQPIEELCIECHEGYGDGLAGGMHPLGTMEHAVPAELVDAGAHLLDDPHQLTCIVCHDTHKAEHESLLHMTADANRLCLACHEDKLRSHDEAGILPKHGQQPVMTIEQQAVVADWGNPVGPNGELLCISCHRVHQAKPNTRLLTFTPQYGETCTACHADHAEVFGTVHDLRTNHPNLENEAGLTPIAAGACSACHMAHRFPRERVVTADDPGGQCRTCHQDDACAATMPVHGTPHPETACIECHDPHTRKNVKFLVADPTALCLECHADAASLRGGPHDVQVAPEQWPAEAREHAGQCLPCHVAHGGARSDLFRFATEQDTGNLDEVCLACHADADWGAQSAIAALHPSEISPAHSHVDLALVPTDERGQKRIGCRTCHSPHGPAEPQQLARVAADEAPEELCLACHVEKRLMRYTGHSLERLNEAGVETDSCKPCHAMHAAPDGAWGDVLSPRFLMAECGLPDAQMGDCVPCLSCHRDDGPGRVRRFAQHPLVNTQNVYAPGDPSYLPLFTADGHVDVQGQVTCRTCHLSHGRVDLLRRLEADEVLSPSQQAQANAQVRAYVEPNICMTCHGAEARILFLYFHSPQHREQMGVGGGT